MKELNRIPLKIGTEFDVDDELKIELRESREYLSRKEVKALVLHLLSVLNTTVDVDDVWEDE